MIIYVVIINLFTAVNNSKICVEKHNLMSKILIDDLFLKFYLRCSLTLENYYKIVLVNYRFEFKNTV